MTKTMKVLGTTLLVILALILIGWILGVHVWIRAGKLAIAPQALTAAAAKSELSTAPVDGFTYGNTYIQGGISVGRTWGFSITIQNGTPSSSNAPSGSDTTAPTGSQGAGDPDNYDADGNYIGPSGDSTGVTSQTDTSDTEGSSGGGNWNCDNEGIIACTLDRLF